MKDKLKTYEDMLLFFSDKTAEYEEYIDGCPYKILIYRTGKGLEIARSDGYRANITGLLPDGRLVIKGESLLYKKLNGGVAYKSMHGMFRNLALTDIVAEKGRIRKIGICNHGFSNVPDMIYLTVKQNKKGCYIATCVYGSYNCPEVWTLRRFRDQTLAKSWYGRGFIRFYYTVSPVLVRQLGERKWFQMLFRTVLDKVIDSLKSRGVENTVYQDE